MRKKVDIFSGFLGAGKTTIIKRLIPMYIKNEKILILENEFGEVSIDGAILSKEGIEVKEINSGCICCKLSGDFKENLLKIHKDFNVNRIILEPSGVAKLSEILKVFNESGLKDLYEVERIITLVDAERFKIYLSNFDSFYKDSIKYAKCIALTRVNKIDNEEIQNICEKIKEINKNAILISGDISKIKEEDILNLGNGIDKVMEKEKIEAKKYYGSNALLRVSQNNYEFNTFTLDINKCISKLKVKEIIKNIENSNYGSLLRAKGILKDKDGSWYLVQYVTNEISITNWKEDFFSRICFTGINLNEKMIKGLMQ